MASLSRSVEGRVVLVTGAGSGIGRAVAALFAEQGARVGVVDLADGPVQATLAVVRAAGATGAGWALDVTDTGALPGLVAEVTAALGPLDILVNNAGVSTPAPVGSEDSRAVWHRTLAVNATAQMELVTAFLPPLLRQPGGRVVNLASTEGLGATAGLSAYTASKHAVVGLTRALAVELGRRGLTVNAIAPGPVNTGMTASIDPAAKETFARRRVPLRRYAEPEEIAQMVLSLALPAASYVNGVVLPVDGGMLAQNT